MWENGAKWCVASSRRRELKLDVFRVCLGIPVVASSRRRELKLMLGLAEVSDGSRLLTEA